METTINKQVKGATMEAIFDNATLLSVKNFKALDLENEESYNENEMYKYEILIRHAENTDANVLFEEERFKTEILTH